MKKRKLSYVVACLALNTAAHSESLKLLHVQSTYIDVAFKTAQTIVGSGFLIQERNSPTRIKYVVTNAHLVGGHSLSIKDSSGALCQMSDALVDSEMDLALFKVIKCEHGLSFDVHHGIGVFTQISKPNINHDLIGPSPHRVAWLRDNSYNIMSDFTWKNLQGDLVSNLEVYPGQSGSPIIRTLDSKNALYDKRKYNASLEAIGKSSWRFFRMSKAVTTSRLLKLLSDYSRGDRGQLKPTRWVLRAGTLTQELDEQTRDAVTHTLASGNGISVDSGSIHATSATKRIDLLQSEIQKYKNSPLQPGMIYQGKATIAFSVALLDAGRNQNESIVVYASMANLLYINQRPTKLKIIDAIASDQDLRPLLTKRSGLSWQQIKLVLAPKIQVAGLDLSHSINGANLFRIEESSTHMWGWDFRNLFLLDFEEIQKVQTEDESAIWRQEWRRGFIKVFGVSKLSGLVVGTLHEQLLSP